MYTYVCDCVLISLQEEYVLHVPLGVIAHVEKMGRSRSKGENAYGLEIFCKVLSNALCACLVLYDLFHCV